MSEYFVFELDCSNSERSVKMRCKQQAYTWNQALSSSRIALRKNASKYRGSSQLE